VIAGLVLAAGEGARFGSEPKLLAPLEGRPLLEHAIEAACAVPALDVVVVVLGAHADEIRAGVDFGRAQPLVCLDWHEGQAASLRRGVGAIAWGADKIVVTLGDEPLVSTEVIARLAGEEPPARATYGGRPGHPVVLGREEMSAVRGLHGDQGARGLLATATAVECGQLCSGRDVDTPQDLEAIRSEARAIV
jgi:molybdenum cofactor cytidylyltransferase